MSAREAFGPNLRRARVQAGVSLRTIVEATNVNEALWVIEDRIREKEAEARFDQDFIELARSVYTTNDRRAAIKREINLALGSQLIEEKQYKG